MPPNVIPGAFPFWMPPIPPNFPLGPVGATAGGGAQQPTVSPESTNGTIIFKGGVVSS